MALSKIDDILWGIGDTISLTLNKNKGKSTYRINGVSVYIGNDNTISYENITYFLEDINSNEYDWDITQKDLYDKFHCLNPDAENIYMKYVQYEVEYDEIGTLTENVSRTETIYVPEPVHNDICNNNNKTIEYLNKRVPVNLEYYNGVFKNKSIIINKYTIK